MFECCENPQSHHAAIFDKYTDKRYKRASQYAQGEIRNGFQIPDVAVNNSRLVISYYNDETFWEKK